MQALSITYFITYMRTIGFRMKFVAVITTILGSVFVIPLIISVIHLYNLYIGQWPKLWRHLGIGQIRNSPMI